MSDKYSPRCGGAECCGEAVECDIFSDDFDRPDDTDIGSDLDELSGSAAISSGQLVLSSSGTAVRGASPSPFGPNMLLECTFELSASSSKLRLYIGDPSASGFLYADIGDGEVTIGQDGGIETTVEDFTIPSGTPLLASLCWDGTRLVAGVNGKVAITEDVSDPPNDYFGIGAATSTVSVDDFTVTAVGTGCASCEIPATNEECISCIGSTPQGNLYKYWYAILDGIGGFCTNCPDVNGVYFFTFGELNTCQALTSFPTGDPCTPDGGSPPWGLILSFFYDPDHKVSLVFAGNLVIGKAASRYEYYSEDPLDCDNLDGLVLSDTGSDPACSGGTVTIARYFG